mgnify:CR=1 FL=1
MCIKISVRCGGHPAAYQLEGSIRATQSKFGSNLMNYGLPHQNLRFPVIEIVAYYLTFVFTTKRNFL